jgi:hypothetical protein
VQAQQRLEARKPITDEYTEISYHRNATLAPHLLPKSMLDLVGFFDAP